MQYRIGFVVVRLVCVASLSAGVLAVRDAPRAADGAWWPGFRGPAASGIGDGYHVPTTWNADTGEGLLWKTEIPGLGHSSPVIWGDRVYVTTAVSIAKPATFVGGIAETSASAGDVGEQAWQVIALDRATGAVVWSRTAAKRAPATDRHAKSTHANPSPATDGRFVAALFGSEGLYVYRADGTLAWSKELGKLDGGWSPAPGASWGFGSSPVIHDGTLVVQCDTQSQSFLAAFELASGRQVWKVERGEDTVWASPTVVVEHGEPIVLVSGTRRHRAYALADGRELWSIGDGADVKVPTPIAAAGLYLFGGGGTDRTRAFYAVRQGARGELAPGQTSIAWKNDATPHVATPLAYRGLLYVLSDAGVLTTYALETGARKTRCRFPPGSYFASLVAADGRVYAAAEEGTVVVTDAGGGCAPTSTNLIGESVIATPALAPGQFVVRGRAHAFAFGAKSVSSEK